MSRKYGQRGYMESEREERSSKPRPRKELSAEERLHRKGMRHAVDRDAHEVVRCHNCGRNADNQGPITFESRCTSCSAPLRCCRTCTSFDTAARWQCRAPIEAAVGDKNKPNRCSHYSARRVLDVTGKRTGRKQPTSARSQFDDLFKS